jgi:hypothetical protein
MEAMSDGQKAVMKVLRERQRLSGLSDVDLAARLGLPDEDLEAMAQGKMAVGGPVLMALLGLLREPGGSYDAGARDPHPGFSEVTGATVFAAATEGPSSDSSFSDQMRMARSFALLRSEQDRALLIELCAMMVARQPS